MTFDDGILTVYETVNVAFPGEKPEIKLQEKEKFYFSYDTLGINRYYTALQAQQQIESVVNIPGWNNIQTEDMCSLESGTQYRIVMAQPTKDENNLRITKLSLERIGENYAVQKE